MFTYDIHSNFDVLEEFMRHRTITLISMLIIVLLCFTLNAQNKWNRPEVSTGKIEKRAYEKYIKDKTGKDYRYTDDAKIGADEIIEGNVIVVEGDLVIEGKINGDVLVILGDVSIRKQARISGSVTSIDGRIHQSVNSFVKGNQIETNVKNLFPERDYADKFKHYRRWDWDRLTDDYQGDYSTLPLIVTDDRVLLRYNRVQGLFLGMAIPKRIGGKYDIINVHGFAGYGFKDKRFNYEVGIDRWFFNQKNYRFELGAKIYDLVDTKDDWLITPIENSLSSFLLHQDLQDFYRRQGYTFHASQNISIFLKGTLEYRDDRHRSVDKNTNWALFYPKRDFKENPAVWEGEMRSLYGEVYLDTRDNKKFPRYGWYGKLSVETSNSNLKSDYSFNQYLFELRRYQPIGRHERIDFRFKAGSSDGELPLQKSYEIGGISTLRGFGYKELGEIIDNNGRVRGYDRMLLANIEYNISPRLINSGFLFFDDIRYILFFDIGNAWFNDDVSAEDEWNSGFSHLKWNDLKSDFGIALTSGSGRFRFNIAKRTDTGVKPITLTIRINKPF